ncbi:hypothetical protein SERLADRAFT_431908 [Serpula lacrymans var. lacrymans S7.9]|nr:uncharacterized protein SERLADRAFT_431908 [Serpula lacrymans var. lacrymans S7.9]EGO30374.1 hypothetical protein SERLADRAFT_431908 [Serpula lacrymans var. lacrymans S7.9]
MRLTGTLTSRNLCVVKWCENNLTRTTTEFEQYWKALSVEDKKKYHDQSEQMVARKFTNRLDTKYCERVKLDIDQNDGIDSAEKSEHTWSNDQEDTSEVSESSEQSERVHQAVPRIQPGYTDSDSRYQQK